MEIYICQYCNSNRKSKKSLTGHETFCKFNPNHKLQTTEAARKKAHSKSKCVHCGKKYSLTNINKHENSCLSNPKVIEQNTRICPVCEKTFIGNSVTCSYSCSNTYFRHGRKGGSQYIGDDKLASEGRYRDLCFRYHDKKCVICGEENIVAVHHLNEDHEDNRPENLIPLCPTHHHYCHSKYKCLVDEEIEKYVINWKLNNPDVGKLG